MSVSHRRATRSPPGRCLTRPIVGNDTIGWLLAGKSVGVIRSSGVRPGRRVTSGHRRTGQADEPYASRDACVWRREIWKRMTLLHETAGMIDDIPGERLDV